jgi:hypothetical protein
MSFSQRKYRLRLGSVLTLLSVLHAGCAQKTEADALQWQMPQQADAIHLTWVKGPPQLQAFNPIDKHLAGFREDAAVLAFRSERWGMLLDPRQMTLERLTVAKPSDVVAELLDFSEIQHRWAQSELELSAEVNGKVYHAVAGPIPPLEDDYSYSPIHIVESGDWFQHVVIYDLELLAADGAKLPAKVWLEIRAWGDRCLFEWCVEPENGKPLELQVGLQSKPLKTAEFAKATGTRVHLGLDFSDESIRPIVVDNQSVQISAVATDTFALGQPKIEYSAVHDAWQVLLPELDWPNKDVAAYNSDLLDRISHYDLKLANTTDAPRDICLRFVHNYHPATGYVPMLLDAKGKQTGLPLQNSKNWHDFRPYPYYGMWFNITARLTLAPNANVDFEYIVAHAQWQGVPASSAAQLSLVGWGYNGFWTEMALGSWGESVCIQAGRTMRRAFITDVRPFEVIGRNGLPYDWTSNVGGGDIGKIVDDQGKLITWQGSVREYAMIGPNLSHVRVTERSAKDRMRLQIDSYLPRSNSINRSYFKVKLEALEDVAFNELALFQLGNDYYNEMESTKIAWGNLEGLSAEVSPAAAKWGTVMEPVQLSGEQPWVSLHANAPEPKAKGRAVRGIVIRDYRAKLGGKVYDAPWIASARTKSRLNAELVLPPEIKQLKAGDTIEMTVEMDILPFSADAYCGADAALKQRLEATPDNWQLTVFEAQHQQVRINDHVQVFPATYALTAAKQQTFTVSSHSKMDTVCVTGLPNPETWRLEELFEGKPLSLGERFSVEAKPQITYVPETETWTAVLSLVFPEGSNERTFSLYTQ